VSSSLVLQRRMKYSGGQGKTINKSGKTVSGIKFDINALNLMCRYVISDNAHVRRSQLFRLRNLLEIMDMTEYMNQPQLMDKIEFIRKALYGRLEKSINETDILIRYISGGLMEEDIEVLWEAIINMFEHDHSAARGKMCMRKLYVFKHDSVLGNCPSHILFDKVSVEETDIIPPRAFSDYKISVDNELPNGVLLIEKL